jgi:hypothetical protein
MLSSYIVCYLSVSNPSIETFNSQSPREKPIIIKTLSSFIETNYDRSCDLGIL